MRKYVSKILIIGGIILLLLPLLSQGLLKLKIRFSNSDLDQLSAEQLAANDLLDAENDYSLIRDIDINSVFSEMSKEHGKAMVGQIKIDDLSINLPILKGTTNSNLMVGATTMVNDQKMGEGNYPLAGHYSRDKSVLFASLLDIEVGTKVKTTDKETIYEYEIYETQLVPDSALHLIEDGIAENRGKPVISLMTCYYTSKNGKRFFAFGELVDTYPYSIRKFDR